MLIENPTPADLERHGSPFCAIRKRESDGSSRVGKPWLEPMGSVIPFVNDQTTWEVVFYATGDKLPA